MSRSLGHLNNITVFSDIVKRIVSILFFIPYLTMVNSCNRLPCYRIRLDWRTRLSSLLPSKRLRQAISCRCFAQTMEDGTSRVTLWSFVATGASYRTSYRDTCLISIGDTTDEPYIGILCLFHVVAFSLAQGILVRRGNNWHASSGDHKRACSPRQCDVSQT